MTSDEFKNAAKEYVSVCLDEMKDEAYDFAEDELGLDPDRCTEFSNLVSNIKVQ